VVYVSGGLEGKTFTPPANRLSSNRKGCTYKPHVIALQANQKLSVNADSTTHTFILAANKPLSEYAQPPGVPLEQTFAREEIASPVQM